jgi:hypothetical protein
MANLIDKLLRPIIDRKLDEAIVTGEVFKKAQEMGLSQPVYPTPRSMFFEPMSLVSATNYKEKMSQVSYDMLYAMAQKTEVVAAILNTRLAQVGSFAQPSRWKNKTGLGYQIRFKDAKRKPTKSEEEYLHRMEEFIYYCGNTDIYRSGERRPNLGEFLRKFLRDSLTYDQACFEIVPDRRGKPVEFWNVDAATIRLAQPILQNFDVTDGRDIVKYVQIYQNVVRHKYTFKEMAFCIRNTDTNIKKNGYGTSELETLINMITSILWAEEYNKRFFSQGQMINGILNFKDSNLPQEQLEAFRRQWLAVSQSVSNAHKMPVFAAKGGIDFVNLHTSNRDMEYSAWMEFLVKISTAVYLIDPAEVNFDYRGASESAPLFETSPEAKLKHSRDKGLRNLLNFVEEKMNFHIVQELDPTLFFEFVGIDMKDEQEIVNIRASEIASYKKLNEIRVDAGLEPIGEEEGGNMILNPTLIQYQLQQQTMQAQQEAAQQGGQEEQGGEDGAAPADLSESVTHTKGFEPQNQPPQQGQ